MPQCNPQLVHTGVKHAHPCPAPAIAANGMGDWVTKQLGGSPATGVDELEWLQTYLTHRRCELALHPAVGGGWRLTGLPPQGSNEHR